MPSGSTYKTRALPTVSSITVASIAARSPIVGSAVGKITLHEIVVVVPLRAVQNGFLRTVQYSGKWALGKEGTGNGVRST